MAFIVPHLLVRIGGDFGDGSQVANWSCGFRFNLGPTPVMSEANKLAFLTNIHTLVKVFHAKTEVAAGTSANLRKMTAAYIDTTGLYVGGGAQDTTEFAVSPVTPGAGATKISWDVARTYTLRTNVPRGRASKGRVYWPCAEPVSTDGRWTGAQVNAAADAFKILVEGMNTHLDTTWPASTGLWVFSNLDAGAGAPVTQVSVGRGPDSQRRRTRKVREEPAFLPVALSGLVLEEELARNTRSLEQRGRQA